MVAGERDGAQGGGAVLPHGGTDGFGQQAFEQAHAGDLPYALPAAVGLVDVVVVAVADADLAVPGAAFGQFVLILAD